MELDFLRWLAPRIPADPRLEVGIGDDAAVFAPLSGRLVTTVDLLTDGVDFRLHEVDPRRIGRKALAVNLSDLAAMAAQPLAAVVALALPRGQAPTLAREIMEGLLPLAAEFQTALAGGDTNVWDGPLALSVTVFGQATPRGPLLRSGARPGDRLLATGTFGGSILGKHFDFTPRVREALRLHAQYELHAGIDVSDGVALDLWRLCQASGCGAELDADRLPISAAARELAARDGRSALEHALTDGEDFELLLAVPSEVAEHLLREQPLDVPLTDIGRFLAEPGLWKIEAGRRLPLAPRGWEHA